MAEQGKKPDAGEWAPKFVTSYYSLGVDQVTPLLADFQRQTLLWVAEYTRQQGLCYIAEKLERLAKGRQP